MTVLVLMGNCAQMNGWELEVGRGDGCCLGGGEVVRALNLRESPSLASLVKQVMMPGLMVDVWHAWTTNEPAGEWLYVQRRDVRVDGYCHSSEMRRV